VFGSGDFRPAMEEYARQDKRIRYFGRVSREEVLEYERKASILVNTRDDKDEFTKFSFPSKTIEYMLSGTPMLTTKLPGIPREYFEHLYCVEDNSAETLLKVLAELSAKPEDELLAFGAGAQRFVVNEKNARAQAGKILRFAERACGQSTAH